MCFHKAVACCGLLLSHQPTVGGFGDWGHAGLLQQSLRHSQRSYIDDHDHEVQLAGMCRSHDVRSSHERKSKLLLRGSRCAGRVTLTGEVPARLVLG